MIIDLPRTSSAAVAKKLVALRNDVGAMTLGRVLTMVIVVDDHEADDVIEAANEATRQHPSRIVVVIAGNRRGANRMDAQIRLGGDAGASEIVVLRLFGALANHAPSVVIPLLLADSPVVAWWPKVAPPDLRADPLAQMAHRRITDSGEAGNPKAMLKRLAETYQPGDTDLAWTRITLWRGLLAAALDSPPYEPVTEAVVAGASDSPSSDLLAAWLGHCLKVPVRRVRAARGSGITSVRLERRSGPVDLVRPDGSAVATLCHPGQPDRRIALKKRGLPECVADELRRLDADEVYAEVLTKGLPGLSAARLTASEASSKGLAPSPQEARRIARRVARSASAQEASEMIVAAPPPDEVATSQVKEATARKLADQPTPREKARKAAKAGAAKKATTKKATAKKTTAKRATS